MVVSRFLRCSGSEESIQWESRPSCASAPSLSFHPMPFRRTQKSYRPRVSHRTMVGVLPTRSACTFQEPNGVEHHRVMKPSAGRPCALACCSRRKSNPDEVAIGGGWMYENSAASDGGRKMSLDIPFYRTFPPSRRLRRDDVISKTNRPKGYAF